MFNTATLLLIALAGIPLAMAQTNRAERKCPQCLRTFKEFDIRSEQFFDTYHCPWCTKEFRRNSW